MLLHDDAVPLDVRIEAFNPLIPADADRSGLPVAVLRYVLTNRTDQPVAATVVGTLPNFIGTDGSHGCARPEGQPQRLPRRRGCAGIFMASEGVAAAAEQWGTLALATTAAEGITYRTAWLKPRWGASLLDFWDDFTADGRLDRRPASGAEMPMASLAVSVTVPPAGCSAVTFLLAWHFPNRMTWTPKKDGDACDCGSDCDCGDPAGCNPDRIGNYYTTQFRDAWDVAEKVAPQLPELEAETVAFVSAFCASDLPEVVKEAALFNLSTLRTQTCFRTPDGRLLRLGGLRRQERLLPRLVHARLELRAGDRLPVRRPGERMREVEFAHATARRRPDELPRRICRSAGRRSSARPPPTGRWAAS